ncbi:hypothetical protein BFP72_03995 [Reichenbachiella sp. 5M10]|uniref:glycosyltransferase n=1 Tax=Reichenbachiella sp. 5M10 TaxID=1889772 RepID=UPI000C154628|nr:glycosyltransferase [Reichenbachiella sp. 5M10]PIB34629.1 hypothetical protein BFP72_03995 [Reichenbachiella sp. 5M10]
MPVQNFVIISLSPWDFEYGSNIRDIALELSQKHKVWFVNIPVKRSEVFRKKKKWINSRKEVIRSKKPSYQEINSNCTVVTLPTLFESINRIKPKRIFDLLNQLNGKRYAKAIEQMLTEKGIHNYYLINDNDFYSGLYLPDYLSAKKNIYYLRDYMRAMSYWKTHSERIEPLLISKYDITLANSTFLAQYAAAFNSESYYVGQGCDIDYFTDHTPPQAPPIDLASIKGEIIGYVGALNSERLNIDLIEYIAQNNPSYQIVLIGPEDSGFQVSNLHHISNVHFLGKKDFSELYAYMYYFNVCINPQNINEITIGNYPRKIDEYLAMGKPTVATHTISMEPFQTVCYLAKDKEAFSQCIQTALEENTSSKEQTRKQLAQSHTWKNSVHLMTQYLNL